METLSYSLEPGQSGHAPQIIVKVPEITVGKIEYDDNKKLLVGVRANKIKALTYEPDDGGAQFRINALAIGRGPEVSREKVLNTIVSLLLLVDQAASSRDQLSPLMRFRPSQTMRNEAYRTTASLAWPKAPGSLQSYAAESQDTMASMYSDILARGQGAGMASSMVAAQIYPVEGICLGVGKPRQWMRSRPFVEGQTEVVLTAQTSHLEHTLMYFGGVVALKEAIHLATE